MTSSNIYFDLTAEFNADGRVAILSSGQAVVWYRLAIMSKDGDWIVRETAGACRRILEVLTRRGGRYRAGAPLDPRWLAAGWSSHFEFSDERNRRIRCDFFSRPPRVAGAILESLFDPRDEMSGLPVVDVESLILMKQTQRAKDYPVIGELARLLPPDLELALTTDPDRILELAAEHGTGLQRPAVRAALEARGRVAVVVALAEEIDRLQQRDRERVERHQRAASDYRQALRALDREALRLPEAHPKIVEIA
ncbi:MAG: hypothetical protein V3T72_19830, partial [Thermoanaerobaculia bacterium]